VQGARHTVRPSRRAFGFLTLFLFSALGLRVGLARAEVLEMPAGGRPVSLGEARVACGPNGVGFVVEQGGRAVRPPASQQYVGDAYEMKVARTLAECATSNRTVLLLTTDTWPVVAPASVVFWPDEGRLELSGSDLAGAVLEWRSGTQTGIDVCRDPQRFGPQEHCTFRIGRDLSADLEVTTFQLYPRGARISPESMYFDAHGRRLKPEQVALVPARVHLTRIAQPDAAIDLATGQGEVPLAHPEAVAGVDCGELTCELENGKVIVRGTDTLVSSLEVKVRLLPHMFFVKKNATDVQAAVKFAVMHCPMSIVSGPPVRHNDDSKLVVKLEGGCAQDLSEVRFVSDLGPLKIMRTVQHESSTYVLLRLGDIADDSMTVSAVREAEPPIVLAAAHTPTRDAPSVRASLELPGFPNLNFIPNNRAAVVHVAPAGEHQKLALLPVQGVYDVAFGANGTTSIRGDPNAAGLTELQFGLRAENLPGGLDQVNLAVVTDPLQRSVHEANIPAPISESLFGPEPLIEVLCGGAEDTPLRRIPVGDTARLPFSMRDTCRVIFHRERLSPEYGTQKLNFEIDVQRSDGSSRGEAHVSEILTFKAGPETRTAWIKGVTEHFDRVIVRVSHVADEAHYIGADQIRTGAPAGQWSLVLGTGRARLYGTTTIPTGLYRFGDKHHSGVLSLNFGVISRLTWLDPEGKEGFLGAEAGVLVIGLANSQSSTGESLTQIGAVIGLGVAVPIANRGAATQASINLHAWFEADLTGNNYDASRYAFIFGPSISIGNVGTNL
jgi:hypothetical protein